MRRYYAIPGNAAKHKRLMAEYGARPEVKKRRARLARERYAGKPSRETMAERTRTCRRCGATFRRNKRGRVRIYCPECVTRRGQGAATPGRGNVGRPRGMRAHRPGTGPVARVTARLARLGRE